MSAFPSYRPGPGHVLHVYKGRETVLGLPACERLKAWLERQIESPAWSDDLTEARKASLAALEAAMAASFPETLQAEAAE